VHLAGIGEGVEIVAARRLGCLEDARDAAQETVARLLERVRAGAVKTAAELAPIAYGIARHVIADVLRARAHTHAELAEHPAHQPDALDVLVQDEERAGVADALERLTPRDRDLLRRCFVDGERVERISAQLGEPAERIRKRKSRALQRLAAILRERRNIDRPGSRVSEGGDA
jgi:RNA polymerase sigma factor (sigma-70 family)